MARRRKNSSPKYGEAGWKAAWEKQLSEIHSAAEEVNEGISRYRSAYWKLKSMNLPPKIQKFVTGALRHAEIEDRAWNGISYEAYSLENLLGLTLSEERLHRTQTHWPAWLNPKRRKNIMSSAAGSYDDYGSYRSQRSSKRDRNPYSKRYTLASFSKKYWGEWYDEVDRRTRLAFWDDFKYAYTGGLGRYKEETRG
jgi:hypothetical protein